MIVDKREIIKAAEQVLVKALLIQELVEKFMKQRGFYLCVKEIISGKTVLVAEIGDFTWVTGFCFGQCQRENLLENTNEKQGVFLGVSGCSEDLNQLIALVIAKRFGWASGVDLEVFFEKYKEDFFKRFLISCHHIVIGQPE